LKNKILLFTLLAFSSAAFAQSSIKGVVTDKKGEPLIGVSIQLKTTYDGTSSKDGGRYELNTDEKGEFVLKASYLGYTSYESTVSLDGKSQEINIILKEKISKIKAVVINAGAFAASDEKQSPVLNSIDMVTTAGGQGDNYGAMKTLPGAQQTNERQGLFVRGGTGTETKTFIDGTLVKNAFTASVPDLGARGRFSPFIFKGTVFSTGGYSALYGQAMSSAVILETIDLPEQSSANANMSSVGLGAGAQVLSKNKKQSYGLNYNFLNLGPYFKVLNQNIDYPLAPRGHQLDLNYRVKTSEFGMLKFYGYYNTTAIKIRRPNVNSLDYQNPNNLYTDEYGLNNKNIYGNLSWREFLGKENKWMLNWGMSASSNDDDIDTRILDQNENLVLDSNFLNNVAIDGNNLALTSKIVLERDLGGLNTIRFGGEYIYGQDEQALSSPYFSSTNAAQDHYKAGFLESDIYLTNDIAGKVGVRLEHSSILQAANIAPRASLAYKLHKGGQISAAYGMYYQKPDANFLFLNNQNLQFQRADHYIINYLFRRDKRVLRAELYYKNYDKLVKTDNATAPSFANNLGEGYARGFELFFRDKKTFKGIDYWISYSYIDTKRDFNNYLSLVQPDFVANHTASFVFKKFWTKKMFGINGTYTYASGRPFNDINLSNPANPNANAAQNFMKGQVQDYHNIGISLNYLPSIFKNVFNVFVLSLNNPFGIKQVYGYNFATQDLNGDGRFSNAEILPSARQFVFIGAFFSWGVDRTDEAIDNNL